MQIWKIGMPKFNLKLKKSTEESFPNAIEVPKLPYDHYGSGDSWWRMLYAIGGGIITVKLLCRCLCRFSQKNKDQKNKQRLQLSMENLPRELLWEIGKRLVSRLDIVGFRSVCKRWRSALPAPSRFPLQVPPPPNSNLSLPFEYFITEVGFYSYESEYVHVALEERHQHGKFRVHLVLVWLNMIMASREAFMMMQVGYPQSLFHQLSFVSKAYHIRMRRGFLKYNDFARKTVILSANGENVNLSYTDASDLSVIALLSDGSLRGRLALLRLGGSPTDWKWETDFCHRVFEDITTYKGKLCALDYHRRIFLMDYHSLQMVQFAVIPSDSIDVYELNEKHLYEVCGELYVAERGNFGEGETGFLRAFKLDMRSNKWVEVKGKYRQLTALMPFVIEVPLRSYTHVLDNQ